MVSNCLHKVNEILSAIHTYVSVPPSTNSVTSHISVPSGTEAWKYCNIFGCPLLYMRKRISWKFFLFCFVVLCGIRLMATYEGVSFDDPNEEGEGSKICRRDANDNESQKDAKKRRLRSSLGPTKGIKIDVHEMFGVRRRAVRREAGGSVKQPFCIARI